MWTKYEVHMVPPACNIVSAFACDFTKGAWQLFCLPSNWWIKTCETMVTHPDILTVHSTHLWCYMWVSYFKNLVGRSMAHYHSCSTHTVIVQNLPRHYTHHRQTLHRHTAPTIIPFLQTKWYVVQNNRSCVVPKHNIKFGHAATEWQN